MALDKVLIVDDDKNICDLLRLYLEKEGYSVILSHDGEEAVVKFNALKPDIVLLDVMLPGLDGWQVCREIRKKSNIPILMITAKSDTFDKVLGLELGADAVLRWRIRQRKGRDCVQAVQRPCPCSSKRCGAAFGYGLFGLSQCDQADQLCHAE